MSAGRFLLYSLLSEEDVDVRRSNFHLLQASNVTEDWFFNPQERSAYIFVSDFFLRYGSLPSTNIVEAEGYLVFPSYPLYEPFEYYLSLFKDFYKEVMVEETIQQIQEHHNNNELQIRDDKLRALVSKLDDFDSDSKSTKFLSEVTQENLDRHRELQLKVNAGGVKFGIPALDAVTGGAQPGDLWVLAGNSGTGKSYITCRMAMAAVLGRKPEDVFKDIDPSSNETIRTLQAIGALEDTSIDRWNSKRVLYISMEMTNNQIGLRNTALGSRISGTQFRLGNLPTMSVSMIETFLSRWMDWHLDDKLILVEGSVTMSVKDVLHKIKEYKPDIVFIDGAYMLRLGGNSNNKSRWETIMHTTEILKKAAMQEGIPIVATYQFDQKSKEKRQDNIMGGQAIGQIASVAIALTNDEEGDGDNAAQVCFKQLDFIKGRNGETGKIRLRFDMARSVISQDGYEGLSVEAPEVSSTQDPDMDYVSPDTPDPEELDVPDSPPVSNEEATPEDVA